MILCCFSLERLDDKWICSCINMLLFPLVLSFLIHEFSSRNYFSQVKIENHYLLMHKKYSIDVLSEGELLRPVADTLESLEEQALGFFKRCALSHHADAAWREQQYAALIKVRILYNSILSNSILSKSILSRSIGDIWMHHTTA